MKFKDLNIDLMNKLAHVYGLDDDSITMGGKDLTRTDVEIMFGFKRNNITTLADLEIIAGFKRNNTITLDDLYNEQCNFIFDLQDLEAA